MHCFLPPIAATSVRAAAVGPIGAAPIGRLAFSPDSRYRRRYGALTRLSSCPEPKRDGGPPSCDGGIKGRSYGSGGRGRRGGPSHPGSDCRNETPVGRILAPHGLELGGPRQPSMNVPLGLPIDPGGP